MDKESDFQEKVKNSFTKAKLDIENIGNKLNNVEIDFNELKTSISILNTKIESIKEVLQEIKGSKTTLKPLKTPELPTNQQSSTIINNHQQSSTINNHQQSSTIQQHKSPNNKENLENIQKTLSNMFRMLTDREFSVFMAVYEFEKQQGSSTYTEIANSLNLTEMTIRGTINRIISKGLPIQKERAFNKKASLFIKKDFHDLNLLQKLIKLRQNPTDQRTLFQLE